MINFELKLHVGLNGPEISAGSSIISKAEVHNITAYAGSRHIRVMGRHFLDYAAANLPIDPLPISPFDSQSRAFDQLKVKERSPDVTGNIGECVAAIIADQKFQLTQDHICHLQIRQGMSTPDYVLRIGRQYPQILIDKIPAVQLAVNPPIWIPAESKAIAKSTDLTTRKNSAFRQLVSYWEQIKDSSADRESIGFGLIFCMKYLVERYETRTIRIFLFSPKNPDSLYTYLKTTDRDTLLNNPHKNTSLNGYLHG
jgi:hypothetical protein